MEGTLPLVVGWADAEDEVVDVDSSSEEGAGEALNDGLSSSITVDKTVEDVTSPNANKVGSTRPCRSSVVKTPAEPKRGKSEDCDYSGKGKEPVKVTREISSSSTRETSSTKKRRHALSAGPSGSSSSESIKRPKTSVVPSLEGSNGWKSSQWVICMRCNKYRRISFDEAPDRSSWECSANPNPEYGTCNCPQEVVAKMIPSRIQDERRNTPVNPETPIHETGGSSSIEEPAPQAQTGNKSVKDDKVSGSIQEKPDSASKTAVGVPQPEVCETGRIEEPVSEAQTKHQKVSGSIQEKPDSSSFQASKTAAAVPQPEIQVLDSKSSVVPEIESVYAAGSDLYSVKWKGRAHIHNSVLTEAEIVKMAPKRMASFKKSVQQGKEIKWNSIWTEPQRVIGKRQGREGSPEWLVKWKGLGYEECTWEADSGALLELAARCEHWSDIWKHGENEKIDRYETQPGWVDSASLRSHELALLNRLRECWCTQREGLVVSDLNEEQITQVVIFVGCLFMEFGAQHPALLITSKETLLRWEAKFTQCASKLNAILYDGSLDARKVIQQYEFDMTEGHPRVQIVLSTLPIVSSDADFFQSMQWSVLLVDRPKTFKGFHRINQLSTTFRVVFVNGKWKESLEELPHLLSFIDKEIINVDQSETEGDFFADVKEKLDARTLWESNDETSDSLREFWIPAQMSPLQVRQYCRILAEHFGLLQSGEMCLGDKSLKDLLLKLRDCCCHPYLIVPKLADFIRNSVPSTQLLEAEVAASGKLQLLCTIISELISSKKTTIVLTQGSPKLMDVLDDFLRRQFGKESYERIQRGMESSIRQASVQRFNAKDSGRFVLLLDTTAVAPHILKCIDAAIIFESCWNPYADTEYLERLAANSSSNYVKVYRLYNHLTVEESILVSALQGAAVDKGLRFVSTKTFQEIMRWGVKDLLQMDRECSDPMKGWEGRASEGNLLLTTSEEAKVLATFDARRLDFSGLTEKMRAMLSPRNILTSGGGRENILFGIVDGVVMDGSMDSKDFWYPLLAEKHAELESKRQRLRDGSRKSVSCCEGTSERRKTKRKLNSHANPSQESGAAIVIDNDQLRYFEKLKHLCELLEMPLNVSGRAKELLSYVITHLNLKNKIDLSKEVALALIWISAEQVSCGLDRLSTIETASPVELQLVEQIYAKLERQCPKAPDCLRQRSPEPDIPYAPPAPVNACPEVVANPEETDERALEPTDNHGVEYPAEPAPRAAEAVMDKHLVERELEEANQLRKDKSMRNLKLLNLQRTEWAKFFEAVSKKRIALLKSHAKEFRMVEALDIPVADKRVKLAEMRKLHVEKLKRFEELQKEKSKALGDRQRASRESDNVLLEGTELLLEPENQKETSASEQMVELREERADDQVATNLVQCAENLEQREPQSLPTEALPTVALPTEALPTEALPTEALPRESLPREALPPRSTGQAQHQDFHLQVTQEQGAFSVAPPPSVPEPVVYPYARTQILDTFLQDRRGQASTVQETPHVVQSQQQTQQNRQFHTEAPSRVQVVEESVQALRNVIHSPEDPLKHEEHKLQKEIKQNQKAFEEEMVKLKAAYARQHQELISKLQKVNMQRQLGELLRFHSSTTKGSQIQILQRVSGAQQHLNPPLRPGATGPIHPQHHNARTQHQFNASLRGAGAAMPQQRMSTAQGQPQQFGTTTQINQPQQVTSAQATQQLNNHLQQHFTSRPPLATTVQHRVGTPLAVGQQQQQQQRPAVVQHFPGSGPATVGSYVLPVTPAPVASRVQPPPAAVYTMSQLYTFGASSLPTSEGVSGLQQPPVLSQTQAGRNSRPLQEQQVQQLLVSPVGTMQQQVGGLQQQHVGLQQVGGLQYQTGGLQHQQQTGGLQHQTGGLQHQTGGLQHQTGGLQQQVGGGQHQHQQQQQQQQRRTDFIYTAVDGPPRLNGSQYIIDIPDD